jgi:D-beta-D-heptose 7-phosphate kinase/D-beta-D-heptose 1-phosphate adenosyltransferase
MKKVIVVSGGFDPIHAGHISLIKAAKELGDYLIVGINSDAWLTRKKGSAFMPWHHRAEVVRNLKQVDEVMSWEDWDDSAVSLLERVKREFPNDQIIFANGGDRTAVNIPEMSVADVVFKFGVGGEDKRGSSSDFLRDWKGPVTQRPWGNYRVIYEHNNSGRATKVKELVIMPGESISMQKHQYRSEYWQVVEGMCDVYGNMHVDSYNLPTKRIQAHDYHLVLVDQWHRISNPYKSPCKIVEIQFGSHCDEEDIIRRPHQLTSRG